MLTTRCVVSMLSVGLFVLGAGMVSGQDYPNKPIRILAGGVGGNVDFEARLVAPAISGPLGQPVVVENRGGGLASGEAASKAAPDGYTLLYVGSSLWVGSLFRKTPFDPVMDFSPITLTSSQPNIMAVHPSVPAKSVKELIALAKTRPGQLNYGMGSVGSSSHLGWELFKGMTGINIVGIPYSNTPQEIADLLSGQVQLIINGGKNLQPHIKSGKLRALAVASTQPSAMFPDLSTVASSGLPGYEINDLQGILAPAKTPESIIKRLNQEIVRVLNRADIKQKLLDAGADAAPTSPEEFANKIKSERAKVGKVISDLGIKLVE